ncbi:unnamed protein product, partial [Prorocentrum cordatum]
AEALFAGLGLGEPGRSHWVQAWLRYGTRGLLARLPLSEAAPSDEDRLAWAARYQEAVSRHRSELEQGFELLRADPGSQDLVITEEAFRMVCRDTFRGLLSEGSGRLRRPPVESVQLPVVEPFFLGGRPRRPYAPGQL